MRTKGANTKKECWCLKIYYPDKNIIIKEGVYITLKDVAKDLGLSYNQTTELTSNGRNKTKNKFNFYPTIELYKIEFSLFFSIGSITIFYREGFLILFFICCC